MRLDIYIHGAPACRSSGDDLKVAIAAITQQIKLITQTILTMPTKAEFEAAFAELGTSLTNISDDITRLTDQLAGGDLTAEEEAEVFNRLRQIADQAKALADRTVDPTTPPVEPTPEP